MGDTMNSTSYDNGTSVSDQAKHSMKIVSLVLHSITFVLGFPGNALVIWIAGVKMKKKVTTIWYVNLAVADLLCCLVIPFIMAITVLNQQWPYGAAMCKVLPTFFIFTMFASVFTLTLISLDRFTTVIWPMWARDHRTIPGAWLLCGLAWLLALLLSLPQLIYSGVDDGNCLYGDMNQTTGTVQAIRTVFGFVVPLLVMTVCYMLFARTLTVKRIIKYQKGVRIMVAVVIAFFVCWTPYHTVALVMEYADGSSYEVADVMFPLVESLAYMNSCLNPVLYVFMGQEFQKSVKVSLRQIFENTFAEDAAGPNGNEGMNAACAKTPKELRHLSPGPSTPASRDIAMH